MCFLRFLILTLVFATSSIAGAALSESEADQILDQATSEIETLAADPLTEEEEGRLKGTALETNVGFLRGLSRCSCARWTFQIKLASGELRTKDLILSTDAILRVNLRMTQQFYQMTERMFHVGPFDLLFRQSRLGLGFSGVTVGSNFDRQVVELIQTGFYATFAAVLRDDIRLDFRSGYEHDSFQVNLGDRQKKRFLSQSMRFKFQRKYFDGFVHAAYLIDANDITNRRARTFRGGLGIGPSWDFKTREALRMGLMGKVDFIYEPWMDDRFGITPTALELGVVLDIRFDPTQIPRKKSKTPKR